MSTKASYSSLRAAIVFLCLAAISCGMGGYLIHTVGWEGRLAHLHTVGMALGVLCLVLAMLPLYFAVAILKTRRPVA